MEIGRATLEDTPAYRLLVLETTRRPPTIRRHLGQRLLLSFPFQFNPAEEILSPAASDCDSRLYGHPAHTLFGLIADIP